MAYILQPKQRHRNWRHAVSVVVFSVLALTCVLLASVWQTRIALVTRAVRSELDRQGFSDATFLLTQLSPGCVVLQDIRLGAGEPVLSVGRVEVLFSYPDVAQGRFGRIRVSGVKTAAVSDGNQVVLPLQERLKTLLSSKEHAGGSTPSAGASRRFSFGELSLYDAQVAVRQTNGNEVIALRCDVSVLPEPDERPGVPSKYRFTARVGGSPRIQARFDGTVVPETGDVTVSGELKADRVEDFVACARRLAPDRMSQVTFFPSNCMLSVRGSLAASAWQRVGPFEMTAEVGRGSAFVFTRPEGLLRFQTLRLEASGTPQDVQCRLSVGLSGFRMGGDIQASQEEGRMLSMRGSARIRQTPTNRWVRATFDSDLPGRSVAQVLPRVLPLVPKLFTDGGTLHVEGEVAQPLQGGGWQGEARYTAEARRSALALTAGRVGAGSVALNGSLQICDTLPGELRTEVCVEEGYFFRQGLSVRGGCQMALTAQPPYASASGVFKGQIGESVALPKSGLALTEGTVRFEGEAAVTGLASNPVWAISVRVPDFGVSGQPGTVAAWQAFAGASAEVSYSATRLALDSDVWLRDAAFMHSVSGSVGRIEAGLGRFDAHVQLPACAPSAVSQTLARVTLCASNGWLKVGGSAALEDVQMTLPLTWSSAQGLAFLSGQKLSWQRLEVAGVRVEPDGFELAAAGEAVGVSFGLRVADSRFGLALQARVPMSDPRQTEIKVSLPLTELTAEDALTALIRRVDSGVDVTGRFSAEAQVRFLGSQPLAVGKLRFSDGRVRRGGLEVSGLAADVPFESGVTFRTIERPTISFVSAKVGNVRLDDGRVAFQVTPQEVFIDRMEVGWCKGRLNAYSVHLDAKNPRADVIVYADRIDLGEALMMVKPFKGVMEGVLYGRFPVGIDNKHVKLSTGFLYSLPGQGGKLRLEDDKAMGTLLKQAGITGDVQQPLSKALSDMDFSAIRMELEPKPDGEAVLRIKLDGKSNFAEWPAPVALNLNLHGPLEKLLNVGLDVSRK